MKTEEEYSCEELMNLLNKHSDNNTGKKEYKHFPAIELKIGVGTVEVRSIAKKTKPNLEVSKCLWSKGIYESRVLAVLVCPPNEISSLMVEQWLKETQSWAICDLIANEIISSNNTLFDCIEQWSKQQDLYLKRGALSSIACRSQDLTDLSQKDFNTYASIIWKASDDNRKHIKTASSWAIREMGKVNMDNKERAISLSQKMIQDESEDRNWVGKSALKELETLIKVPERLRLLSNKSSVGKKYEK